MLLERCQFWLVSGSNKQSFSFLFLVKVKLLKGLLCLLSTQLTNFIKHYFELQGWINCLFSCHVWGFDLLRNQQGAVRWCHTMMFSVPEIKQEYFHINRYPTIPIVVYITTIVFVVCICLITSKRAVSDLPSHPSKCDNLKRQFIVGQINRTSSSVFNETTIRYGISNLCMWPGVLEDQFFRKRFFYFPNNKVASPKRFYLFMVSRRDWLWKLANIKVENNGAAGYVGSSLIVHNPLFFVHKLTE